MPGANGYFSIDFYGDELEGCVYASGYASGGDGDGGEGGNGAEGCNGADDGVFI